MGGGSERCDATLEYRILGPLEVIRAGRPLVLRSGPQRVILAALLLRHGRPVPTDRLLEWLGDEERMSRNALQLHIKRLRTVLGAAGAIVQRHDGYLVPDDTGRLDLARFDALVSRARTDAGAGDNGAALARLREAGGLWRGPILAGVPCPSLHSAEVPALTERCLDACEWRFELELSTGSAAGVVQELTALHGQYPLRERLLSQLMQALHRSGRQVEALEAYQAHAVRLREEFGLDPGPALRETVGIVLRGEPAAELRSAPVESSPRRLLPRVIGDFVGRSAEMARADRILLDTGGPAVPVVVVTGTAGVGKSAFALRVAHRVGGSFPDGHLYACLGGSTTDPRDLADVLADFLVALGVPYGALPPGLPARTALLRDRLADRKVLLVLDDVAKAAEVEHLLPGTAGCAVLVTSRLALSGLAGVHRVKVAPLSTEEGVELLGRLLGGTRVAREDAAAHDIVALCGGLPLALRIAGIRLDAHPSMPLEVLAERLRDDRHRLDELATDELAVRASLDISYAGLDEGLRVAFRRVGLLPIGDFAAWTLGQLTDGGHGERETERLVLAGLLQPAGIDLAGQPRYRPHDLVALYARELAERDDPDQVRAAVGRLVDTMAQLGRAVQGRVARIGDVLPPQDLPTTTRLPAGTVERLLRDPVAWARASQPHLLDAVARACRYGWCDRAALVADLTFPVLYPFAQSEPFRRAYEDIVQSAQAAGAELVAWRAEYIRAGLLIDGRLAEAAAGFARCVTGLRRLAAHRELVYALVSLEFSRSMLGQPVEEQVHEALRVARSLGDPTCLMLALRARGESLVMQNRTADALPVLAQALELTHVVGDESTRRLVLNLMAKGALALGDAQRAHEHVTAAMQLVDEGTNPRGLAWLLIQRGRIALAANAPATAMADAARAREIHERIQDRRGVVSASVVLAEGLLETGQPDAAVRVIRAHEPLIEAGDARSRTAAEAILERAGANASGTGTDR